MSDSIPPAIMLDKRQARAAFERAADTYDDSAVLQREIANRMLERLDLIRCSPQRVLDVGCRTGHCSRALQKRYKGAVIVGVDLAYGMARAAQTQTHWRTRQRFVCGDAETLPVADAAVDMIVSNLTLQWCTPDTVFQEFARVLRPGGVLMFTSFGPDTLHELRAAWRAVDERPHVHTFLDMHDVGDALVRAGFAEPVMDVEHFTLTYPDVMALLRDLKRLGAHNVDRDRLRGLTGKASFASFKSAYEAHARDGLIPASYEAVYGHAWAAESRSRVRSARSVSIPLDQLKR
ncbi:MAG: malonyl-ACP O-methyltransferase BioC [Acidiferrobacterales bacterium]